ncbi:SDR family NAD(P)-dependent oxidoreductase [Sodalis ligni]|jgi:NAD(P)-dependent dehydrogenase (short-subunit alcohol dehydrogenase family)|uniref:NAD(P)-dependent dehydrogenase (Short-subunit alcohol dehydrogenase family) n=1 Tax=Sodalis ligni TaxID=2697027 RepID=A0A4R1NIL9_9GAMM|nr:SDR family oxidoreductase [Sodalis ligni]TCL05741.1 NAD(P)-dependent dehydrogenase (short-subunit alcohol dehydrogenase family) [Sodalis ligni]
MSHKIALITGASRGLGKSIAQHLARQGVDIIGTYHSKADEARALADEIKRAGGKAAMVQLDVGESAGFGEFAAKVGQVLSAEFSRNQFDFLVNNAGVGLHAAFAQTTEEQFELMFKVHLKGPYFLTQKLLPLIADGGRIVNISSGLARFSFPGSSAYAAMKGGVEVLTRYLAKELGDRGISANTLAPGAIETDFSGGMVRDTPEINRQIASATALGRVGLPDDIGAAVASLLAEGNGWINGQRIEASGGIFL